MILWNWKIHELLGDYIKLTLNGPQTDCRQADTLHCVAELGASGWLCRGGLALGVHPHCAPHKANLSNSTYRVSGPRPVAQCLHNGAPPVAQRRRRPPQCLRPVFLVLVRSEGPPLCWWGGGVDEGKSIRHEPSAVARHSDTLLSKPTQKVKQGREQRLAGGKVRFAFGS